MRNHAEGPGSFRAIWLRPLVITAAIVVADQISKRWIWERLGPEEGTSVPLLGDWLKFTLVKNTGVAFGMFQNNPQFFTVTSILISLGAVYFYRYHLPNRQPLIQLALGMILGGAIGNIIDRLRFNFVIDFVHVTWFPGIFNLADSMITLGTILLAGLLLLKGDQAEPPATPDDEALLGDLLSNDGWSKSGEGQR